MRGKCHIIAVSILLDFDATRENTHKEFASVCGDHHVIYFKMQALEYVVQKLKNKISGKLERLMRISPLHRPHHEPECNMSFFTQLWGRSVCSLQLLFSLFCERVKGV